MGPIGVGLGGPETVGDKFKTLVAQWNTARFLSKPKAVRSMMLLRQKGQGGTFDTEAQALQARIEASQDLDPITFDLLVDTYHAGFNAYETLVLRSINADGEMPDLSRFPPPARDLDTSTGPQPFDQWIYEHAPDGSDGPGSKWTPLLSDHDPIGSTWAGMALRTTTPGVYIKTRFIPYGANLDLWVRTA